MTDTVDKVIIQSSTQGVTQTTNEVQGLSKAMDGVTIASQNVERSTTSVEGKFKGLERQLATTEGQAQKLARVQETVNRAVAQNPALQERANAVLAAAEARYSAAGRAAEASSKSTGLARYEIINLSRQLQDLGVSLASGQSPFTVLIQQGTQVADVFANSQGSVRGFLGQLTSGIGRIITPMNATIAATVALGAATAALALQYDRLQTSSQRALTGAGARTGTSVTDINRFVQQNSGGLSGSGLSNREARDLAEELTKTGDIVISKLKGMSDAVVGFSNQTGKSMEEARKAIVGFAADPQKALDELSKTYGSFDASTRRAVDALVLADDKTGAFNVVLDALSEKSKKAAQNMGFFESAARAAINVLARETVKPSGLEDELAGARARLSDAESSPFQGKLAQANLQRLREEVERLQAAFDKVEAGKAASEIAKLSTEADANVRAIIPQIEQVQKLEAQLAQLERAKAAGATSKYGPEVDNSAAVAIANQLTALREAQAEAARYNQQVAEISLKWGDVSQSTAIALQQHQNMLPTIQAVTGAQQMAAQYAADYANALMQGKSQADALAIATMALEKAQAAATANVEKQIEALKDQNDMIKAAQRGTEAQTAAAIAYKNAIASGASETSAANLQAATLRNYMLQAQSAASGFASSMQSAASAMSTAASFGAGMTQVGSGRGSIDQWDMNSDSGSFSGGDDLSSRGRLGGQLTDWSLRALSNYKRYQQIAANDTGLSGRVATAFTSGGTRAALDYAMAQQAHGDVVPTIFGPAGQKRYSDFGMSDPVVSRAVSESEIISQVGSLYDLLNSQTSNKSTQLSNMNEQLAWLQSRPVSIEQQRAIVDLRRSIEQLKNSTDDLNSTNRDLLSPYYSQDPRTSKIGFRSQGMASGGYVDVPGSPSSNDNMLAMIPVASGERIYVDPMPSRRGGASQIINISVPITIVGNANRDEVGRTVYQTMQVAARQLQAANR